MYGSSLARTYYGAGDYQTRSAFLVPGYYSAGGLFSGIAKLAGKVAKVASNPIVSTALSFVPGGGLVSKAAGVLSTTGGIAGALSKVKGLAGLGAKALGVGANAAVVGNALGGFLGKSKAAAGGAIMLPSMSGGTRKRSSSRGRARSSRRGSSRGRRRRSSRYSRGDWGDDGGRDKKGHFLNERGGHRHFRRRRRRRRGTTRVSFTTKSGRRVTFNARGDDE